MHVFFGSQQSFQGVEQAVVCCVTAQHAGRASEGERLHVSSGKFDLQQVIHRVLVVSDIVRLQSVACLTCWEGFWRQVLHQNAIASLGIAADKACFTSLFDDALAGDHSSNACRIAQHAATLCNDASLTTDCVASEACLNHQQ
jgi:hypothetical protein